VSDNGIPSHVELRAARAVVSEHHPRTPLYRLEVDPLADRRNVFIKYENHGPVRSFKARGALYSLWRLDAHQRSRGVVTASTGNHGRGIAYAAAELGIPATIVIPRGTPAVKFKPIERLGADLRVVDGSLVEATATARAIAEDEDKLYLEDGEDAGLLAGAATVAWEILEELPDADCIVVPVGGGNLIAATALLAKEILPSIRIVGVQSAAAPAVARSWEAGKVTAAPCATFAGGLATTTPGHLAFEVMKDRVDDMVLVSEDTLEAQIIQLLASTGEVAEHAGAAAFAALVEHGGDWRGNVVLVLTGGNIEFTDLHRLVSQYENDE